MNFKTFKRLFNLPKKATIQETFNHDIFYIGDKVRYSEYALRELVSEKSRNFRAKHVWEIARIEILPHVGQVLYLTCGTYLLYDEAEKVDINTPLHG